MTRTIAADDNDAVALFQEEEEQQASHAELVEAARRRLEEDLAQVAERTSRALVVAVPVDDVVIPMSEARVRRERYTAIVQTVDEVVAA
eukprot:CAMPEP_0206332598 /NCGR_PEP_ID=MMETSP0106_2-20121207/24849_1 /ASSEMBLY_ACC=CAM_ASM_000206 /TAXON_ID=81532 /ORGANISM="Acanthoeca-like sp., Strain 10tr" /LENGTH=88 /DNA_ID=CAMNT_0053765457 /DNA_START=10 /DNA_END=272 /DNA_ORIENTATION=-